MRIELQEILSRYFSSGYVRYHIPRYMRLFDAVCNHYKDDISILDIGKSPFTEALISKFGSVDTLGFNPDMKSTNGNHYQFNLNDCRDKALWRHDLPIYDLIVFAEVVEHLHTSPNQVFAFLSNILKKGGILFLQTPNAVVLHKRIKMILGKNPFELIRENYKNPGHYREYTYSELAYYLSNNGFVINSFSYENYFDYQYSDHSDGSKLLKNKKKRLFNAIYYLLPPSLKPGMFFVAKKM